MTQLVLSSFKGGIEPVHESGVYRLAIGLVSATMLLLPLIYVGIIGLVMWLLAKHVVNDVSLFTEAGGSSGRMKGALLIYVAPIVAGVILIVFMIKPLFARPVQRDKPRSLSRESEPVLFAFVDRICTAVGAPQPKRIDVDCQVNASASFRRGLLSMFGNDMVLTIGLPLVGGLTQRQFAGVLAHEFGHFSQGVGMRLSYLIRVVNFWFARVVYERDSWDEWLRNSAQALDLRLGIVLYIAMFCVFVTRKILWVLMTFGHFISGFLMRQMEFDADRYEARLAGSEVFASTCRRLHVINIATQGAYSDLGEFYREGRLGDNLPRLIEANLKQVPKEISQYVDKIIDESKTGFFDTHPADKERIASAQREQAPGIFHIARPATELFSDFAVLSKTATWDYYRHIFGPQFRLTDMHPVEQLLERQNREIDARKALGRYLQGTFAVLRPFAMPSTFASEPGDPKACALRIKASREQLLKDAQQQRKLLKEYDDLDTRLLQAFQAEAMHHAGLKLKGEPWAGLTKIDQVNTVRRTTTAEMERLAGQLEPLEKSAGERIFAAMQLLQVPKVADKLEQAAAWSGECDHLLAIADFVAGQYTLLLQLRNEQAALGILLASYEGNEKKQELIDQIISRAGKVHRDLCQVRGAVAHLDYPFEHAKGRIKLDAYALESIPPKDNVGAVYEAGQQVGERIVSLYVRVVARLTMIAENVERVVGLAPLAEVKNDEPKEEAAQAAAAAAPS